MIRCRGPVRYSARDVDVQGSCELHLQAPKFLVQTRQDDGLCEKFNQFFFNLVAIIVIQVINFCLYVATWLICLKRTSGHESYEPLDPCLMNIDLYRSLHL